MVEEPSVATSLVLFCSATDASFFYSLQKRRNQRGVAFMDARKPEDGATNEEKTG